MKTVVAIVEDNPSFRQAITTLIQESDEFLLGGVYPSGERALRMQEHPPDVALVDIQLPGISGIDLIKRLHLLQPGIQFLVCSMHDDDDKIIKALESGASGYLLKDSTAEQIRDAIIELRNGGAPMSPYIARRVIQSFQKPAVAPQGVLSDREREVVHLLAQGLQYKEIADGLHISYETVKKHLRNVYGKLHVQNKVEAINKFRSL